MKIAINQNVIGKPTTTEEQGKLTFTYQNADLNQEELAESINQGFAFCAQHKDGHRKSANFTEAGFLAVDIDSGLSVQAALDNSFVKDYAAILYTTPSHTEDFPRFRIVFELERLITSATEMKNAYRGIIKKFGGDPSCKDACRQFYGSKDSNPLVFNNTLTSNILDEIIELGKESRIQNDTAGVASNGRHSIVSRITLDPDDLIRDAEGNSQRLQDIPERTSVHCPIHADSKPSAFVVKSQRGVKGVHCSTCGTTYFTSSDIPLYDFNYGLSNLTELSLEEYETIEEDEFLTYANKDIIRLNHQYLPELDTVTPITLVKSPKGTGKTQWLESIVKKCEKNYLSVLLIGHRQSLIQSVARRLGLTSYIYELPSTPGDPDSGQIRKTQPTRYYAICADSLSTLLNTYDNKYDVVLIDEVEQVFSHLTSNTVKDRRIETFLFFKHYVNNAKQLIVMDADLNALTVNALWDFIDDKTKEVKVIINEYTQPNRVLDLYSDKAHLLYELTNSLDNNQRCFVCSNSKKQINKLAKYIEERFGSSKKVMAITSDNSQNSSIQEFIRNIKKAVLEYDVVMVSPSVGTGVDITFPYMEQNIDAVYGFFEARVNTHFDIDQQISRVRHPKSIRVWISPERFRFDTNPEVIKREVERIDRSVRQLIEIKPDGTPVFSKSNDEYLNLYTNVKSMQRGSKNNLRYHFKKLKEHEGWTVHEIERDEESAEEGLEIARRGKELYEQERIQKIVNAKLITKDEYISLTKSSERKKLSLDEDSAMRRYEIESFFYQDATEELVASDNDGKLRQQIKQYELYTKPDSALLALDAIESKKESLHKTDKKTLLKKKKFLHQLFISAGLADKDNDFLANQTIEGDSLSDFADFCTKHKETIARWFEIDIRNDIHRKPAQQLGRFLKMLGITWTKLKPVKKSGVKIYRYEIPQATIDELNAIAEHRHDSSITQKWHQDRNASTDNRLFEPEDIDDVEADEILSLTNL